MPPLYVWRCIESQSHRMMWFLGELAQINQPSNKCSAWPHYFACITAHSVHNISIHCSFVAVGFADCYKLPMWCCTNDAPCRNIISTAMHLLLQRKGVELIVSQKEDSYGWILSHSNSCLVDFYPPDELGSSCKLAWCLSIFASSDPLPNNSTLSAMTSTEV